jgi:Domain of unknown function (DUF5117)
MGVFTGISSLRKTYFVSGVKEAFKSMKYLFLLIFFGSVQTYAQNLPTIEEKTKGLKSSGGFLPFYWDGNAGKIWIEIGKAKLDSEILYQTSIPAGIGLADVDNLERGALGTTYIVKFSKVGRQLLLIQSNYGFRALTADSNEKRDVEQSFPQSTLWGFTIEAESDSGRRVLVDATDFILKDVVDFTNNIRKANLGNYRLERSRSAIYLPKTKSFSCNTEIEATLTFLSNDASAGDRLIAVTPSSEAVTIRVHHSFVRLPDNNYKPRKYDIRSGFFTTSFLNYSAPVSEPLETFYIERHRLPVTYYLDNGIPEPVRSALLEGARWWSQAFEAAGYKDAFKVDIFRGNG